MGRGWKRAGNMPRNRASPLPDNADLNWLKKNLALSHKEKLLLIDKLNSELSISHQAELLGISRSSIYYEPVVDEYDLLLKRLIDEQYTLVPFFGSRRMKVIMDPEIWTVC